MPLVYQQEKNQSQLKVIQVIEQGRVMLCVRGVCGCARMYSVCMCVYVCACVCACVLHIYSFTYNNAQKFHPLGCLYFED